MEDANVMGAMLGSFFSYRYALCRKQLNLSSPYALNFFCSSVYQHILYQLFVLTEKKNVIQNSFEFLDLFYAPMLLMQKIGPFEFNIFSSHTD